MSMFLKPCARFVELHRLYVHLCGAILYIYIMFISDKVHMYT